MVSPHRQGSSFCGKSMQTFTSSHAHPPLEPAVSLACGWTWTTLPPEILFLLCCTDTIIYSVFWVFCFLLWSFKSLLYCMFRRALGPIQVTTEEVQVWMWNELKIYLTLTWSGLIPDGFMTNGKPLLFSCTAQWFLSVANFPPLYLSFSIF